MVSAAVPSANNGNNGNCFNTIISKRTNKLAPFNPTCDDATQVGLRMLNLQPADVLFDLGCGDARVLVSAATATQGLRCVGIEMDPVFVAKSLAAVAKLSWQVQQRIDIRQGDVLVAATAAASAAAANVLEDECHRCEGGSVMLSSSSKEQSHNCDTIRSSQLCGCSDLTLQHDCSAVYLYLLPKGLLRIQPLLDQIVVERRLEQKQKGCATAAATTTAKPTTFRVVTYMFQMHGWTVTSVNFATKARVPVYLYEFDHC